jgi:hypothetical protein
MAGDASVMIGPIGNGAIVQEFYRGCPAEVMGPGAFPTGAVNTYSTLEGLIDLMLASTEDTLVVVNHGNDKDGLLVPFTGKSPHTATGLLIADLATLANASGIGVNDSRIINVASQMGVQKPDALRLVQKLASLQVRKRIIFFRGCNLGANPSLLASYRVAFGAAAVQAPNCRMFYLRIRPHIPSRGHTMPSLSTARPTTTNTRRRTFNDPTSTLGPLIVDVRDINGHAKVDTESFSDRPMDAGAWGARLLPRWLLRSDNFIVEVLWDNALSSYSTPLEESYRTRFVFA